MLKILGLLPLMFISACLIYVIPDTETFGSVVLRHPYVDCYYDSYYHVSEWYFEIEADSYYGPTEVSEVGFYINNYDFQLMEYAGGALWVKTFVSSWFDCDQYYHYDFVGIDYDGYEGYYSHHW